MTPTQIKEAFFLMSDRDILKIRLGKVKAYGSKVNVYLGTPQTHTYRDPWDYAGTRYDYVDNFSVSSQIVIDGLERELTDITNKLKGLGVTD